MSTRPLIQALNRIGLSTIAIDDLNVVIQHLHAPALILGTDGTIVSFNQELASLIEQSPESLRGSPNHTLGCTLPENNKPYATTLRHRNQKQIPCQATPIPLGTNYWLILLEPEAAIRSRQIETERNREKSQALQTLLTSFQDELSFEEKLQNLLESGRLLCGVESLLFYRLDNRRPSAYLAAYAGEPSKLPEAWVVPENKDLEIWRPGDPPRSALLRRAAQLGYQYVAQTPVGEAHALVGWLVGVHPDADPLPDLPEWLKLTAALVDQVIAQHGQMTSLLNTLQEAREDIAWLQDAYERVDDGIFLLDEHRVILQANPAACSMLGYQRSKLVGRPVAEILNVESWPEGNGSITATVFNRNGEPLIILLTQCEVKSNPAPRSLLILNDQTRIVQVKTEIEHLHHRAMLGQMSGVLAHEIRNPLNNIHLALQTLAHRRDLPENVRQRVHEIIEESDRLLRLVKDMLTMQRRTQGSRQLIHINALINDVVRFFLPRARRYGVDIHFSPAQELPPIKGNPETLRQVIMNLMDNSVSILRNQKGGVLGIRTQTAVDEGGNPVVEIYVADNGPGIPKEMRDRIFTLGVTGREEGTGIGLAISRQIINLHKGSLTLIQGEPSATIFRIRLPVAPEETP